MPPRQPSYDELTLSIKVGCKPTRLSPRESSETSAEIALPEDQAFT